MSSTAPWRFQRIDAASGFFYVRPNDKQVARQIQLLAEQEGFVPDGQVDVVVHDELGRCLRYFCVPAL